MKCKKSLMGLAALLILMFHFNVPFIKSPYEIAFYKAGYIGVDLFFFVSAYSLGKRDKIKYGSFILNRLMNTYLPFVVLTIIYAVFKQISVTRFFAIISGVEFFQRGGGSFLWFCIGIMLIYLLVPFIVALKTKFGWKAFVGMLIVWAGLSALLEYAFGYTTIFILLHRLPIFIIGLYYDQIRKIDLKAFKLPLIIAGLVGGAVLMYFFGTTKMLKVPFKDMNYIVAIVPVVSIVGLFDFVSSRVKFKNIPLQFIGGITLELYGLQMIFGYDIEPAILKPLMKGPASSFAGPIAFFATAAILIVMAEVFHLLRVGLNKLVKKVRGNN